MAPLLERVWKQWHIHIHIQRVGSNLRLKLYQNTEFDEIWRGPKDPESVAGCLYLAPDTKVSYSESKGYAMVIYLWISTCKPNLTEFKRVRQIS